MYYRCSSFFIVFQVWGIHICISYIIYSIVMMVFQNRMKYFPALSNATRTCENLRHSFSSWNWRHHWHNHQHWRKRHFHIFQFLHFFIFTSCTFSCGGIPNENSHVVLQVSTLQFFLGHLPLGPRHHGTTRQKGDVGVSIPPLPCYWGRRWG